MVIAPHPIMGSEAQKLISVSLEKLALCRRRRREMSLHKNLLVSTVIQKARLAIMEETYLMMNTFQPSNPGARCGGGGSTLIMMEASDNTEQEYPRTSGESYRVCGGFCNPLVPCAQHSGAQSPYPGNHHDPGDSDMDWEGENSDSDDDLTDDEDDEQELIVVGQQRVSSNCDKENVSPALPKLVSTAPSISVTVTPLPVLPVTSSCQFSSATVPSQCTGSTESNQKRPISCCGGCRQLHHHHHYSTSPPGSPHPTSFVCFTTNFRTLKRQRTVQMIDDGDDRDRRKKSRWMANDGPSLYPPRRPVSPPTEYLDDDDDFSDEDDELDDDSDSEEQRIVVPSHHHDGPPPFGSFDDEDECKRSSFQGFVEAVRMTTTGTTTTNAAPAATTDLVVDDDDCDSSPALRVVSAFSPSFVGVFHHHHHGGTGDGSLHTSRLVRSMSAPDLCCKQAKDSMDSVSLSSRPPVLAMAV